MIFVTKIIVRDDEPIESALKRFKKKCEKEGLIKDIKRSMTYEKPSDAKREKARKILKRLSRNRKRRGS